MTDILTPCHYQTEADFTRYQLSWFSTYSLYVYFGAAFVRKHEEIEEQVSMEEHASMAEHMCQWRSREKKKKHKSRFGLRATENRIATIVITAISTYKYTNESSKNSKCVYVYTHSMFYM